MLSSAYGGTNSPKSSIYLYYSLGLSITLPFTQLHLFRHLLHNACHKTQTYGRHKLAGVEYEGLKGEMFLDCIAITYLLPSLYVKRTFLSKDIRQNVQLDMNANAVLSAFG